MKKAKFSFVIVWAAGGETRIDLTVSYNGAKANKQPNFQEALKSKLGSIISRIGENKEFPFSLKTQCNEVGESRYYGEDLTTIKISGENPACAESLKKKIEKQFQSELLADKVIETVSHTIESMDQMLDDAFEATRTFLKDSGKWPGAIVICIRRIRNGAED